MVDKQEQTFKLRKFETSTGKFKTYDLNSYTDNFKIVI